MPVPSDVSTQILTAQLKLANMVDANILALQGGSLSANWKPSIKAWVNINLVNYLNNSGDNSSNTFLYAYACMNNFIGSYAGGTIDPNAQIPGTTVITVPIFAGNSTRINFTTTGPFVLNYAGMGALYGNNPSLTVYTVQSGVPQMDEQTAPTLTLDGSGNITQITWDYPIGITTNGYVLISGFVPTTTGGIPSGGGSAALTFNQTNLLFDGSQWYIALNLPAGTFPVQVFVNGVTQGTTYDTNFSPARLYSFGDSGTAQAIIVYIQ